MIAEPPFDAGADQDTDACAFPPDAETDVGTPGVVAGVIEPDAIDTGALIPYDAFAVTVNV